MASVNLTDTLILSPDAGQMDNGEALAVQNVPGTDKAIAMAELSYQQAQRGYKTLVISESVHLIEKVLGHLVSNRQIRAFRLGSAGSAEENALTFSQDKVADAWLSQVAEQCRQDLLVMRDSKDQADSMRLELDKLTKRQSEIGEEYVNTAAKLAASEEQWRELAELVEQEQQNYRQLRERQEGVQAEQEAIMMSQPESSKTIAMLKQKIDSLQAAKQQTETVIAQNRAAKNDLTIKLARLSQAAALGEQSGRLEEAIADRRYALRRLEGDKKKLVKCLEMLTAQQPDEIDLSGKSQEEKIMTLWQYQHYLNELVAAALEVYQQQQAPVNPILNQDIALLENKIYSIKERQSDLISIGKTTINEFHEIVKVIVETAEEYGWTTSLFKSDIRDVSASYQSFSRLHEATVELLWSSPPKVLTKLGFCTDWKEKLFELVVRAKAMEQLVDSPNTIYEHTVAEIEAVLMECRYLSQRVYEACYKHLLACGQMVEQTYNQIQADLAAMSRQLQDFGNPQNLAAQIVEKAAAEKLNFKQCLEQAEAVLGQAQAELKQQESELAIEQQALMAISTAEHTEYQQALDTAAVQLAAIEQQLELQDSTLSDSSRRLDELQDEIEMSKTQLEVLTCDQRTIDEPIAALTAKLEETLQGFNETKLSLTAEWLNRLSQASNAEKRSITPLYITHANVMGMTFADVDTLAFTQISYEYDVIITDNVNAGNPSQQLLAMYSGKKVLVVE